MYNQIQIGSDPTVWMLRESVGTPALSQPGQPVTVATTHPLVGTLLISPQGLVSAVLTELPVGAIPIDAQLPASYLYLPAAAGLDLRSPGYALPAGTDVAGLQAKITGAMTRGGFVSVPVTAGARSGLLVLNGATLSFALLVQSSPAG